MAKELSIFVDESGDRGGEARYYLLTLVFHDQANEIMREILAYEKRLSMAGLPNIAFHSEPLLNGHKEYGNLTIEQAADYFCTIELAAVKYDANEDGKTYNKFFGGSRDFKKNWLKQARRMSI